MKKNFFYKKKIIITGHTGFKGSWLTAWLSTLGSEIYGISLNERRKTFVSKLNFSNLKKDYFFDIKDYKKIKKTLNEIKPDIIFHLAAQSLVNLSYLEPIKTWESNLIGSLNILDAVKHFRHKCIIIMITSDKCYKNLEKKNGYMENDILGGSEPYSASKASTEIMIKSYFDSFLRNKKNIRIASCRAGNVIGGGDWSKDRIIPDCVKSWFKNEVVKIKNPNSVRPWQHVLEPLSGYMTLCKQLTYNTKLNGESFNFGPSKNKIYSVIDIVKIMGDLHPLSKWKIKKNNKIIETKLLKLNSNKAMKKLKWKQSVLDIKQTLKFTYDWYYNYYKQSNISKITKDQIEIYSKKISKF